MNTFGKVIRIHADRIIFISTRNDDAVLLFSLYRLMPANRAYTDAKQELQTLKGSIPANERDTKFDELYLKYQRLYGIVLKYNQFPNGHLSSCGSVIHFKHIHDRVPEEFQILFGETCRFLRKVCGYVALDLI